MPLRFTEGFDPFLRPIEPSADLLTEVLDELGWRDTPEKLAVAAGVSPMTMSRWLAGTKIPRATFYGVLFVAERVLELTKKTESEPES